MQRLLTLFGAMVASPFERVLQSGPNSCVQFDGLERCWKTYAPFSQDGRSDIPIVIDLHGFPMTNQMVAMAYTGWFLKAKKEKFFLVRPQGYEKGWNAGGPCCGKPLEDDIDDVGFLNYVITHTLSEYSKASRRRVYVTGHSAGCAMAQRMAAEANGTIAAVACHSFYRFVEPPSSYDPVPIMEIHGERDPNVNFRDFKFTKFPSPGGSSNKVSTGAIKNIDEWARLNKCTGGKKTETKGRFRRKITTTKYEGCDKDVELVTLPNAGHLPYGLTTGVDTTDIAWRFLKKHSSA